MRKILLPGLLVAMASTASSPARAAESYDGCSGFIDSVPATITTPGVWCFRADLSTAIASGNAVTVESNNVTVDCNHFRLGGLGAGAGSDATGIRSLRVNTSVRNCNVRGFRFGIWIVSAGGNLVESNRLDGNLNYGIYVSGAGSTVQHNKVFDTGGSTLSTNTAYAISGSDGTDIVGNTVSGVSTIATNTVVMGIVANFNGSGVIRDNRIRGVIANGSGIATGIGDFGSPARTSIRDNDILGSGADNSVGIRCVDDKAVAFGNVILGFATGIESCTQSGNTINNN